MIYAGIAKDPGDLLQVIFTENISEVNAPQERNVKKKSSTRVRFGNFQGPMR